MLHTIRKLARSIHRRSVWQVLAGFLVFSWATLEVVDVLTRSIGLPLWTPRFAMVLLAVGLPFVVATAAVQGGIPWLRITDVVDPNELEGLTPDQVHVVPEAHPLYGVGIFTWRNAVLGGVMAAALLITSVVSYLAMWALGIGPVGSLVAQGVLAQDDTLIVAEFSNRSEAASVAATVTGELQRSLARSRVVVILEDPELSRALGSSDSARGDRRRPGIAGVLESRPDVDAVVDGEVLRVRDGYRIRVTLVSADGITLARFEDHAPDTEGLRPGVERVAARLRERIGESLRVIRADSPVEP